MGKEPGADQPQPSREEGATAVNDAPCLLAQLDGPAQRVAWRRLAMPDAAEALADLLVPPGNRLEKLTGDRAGRHSIRINRQWRICFYWSDAR